MSADWACCFDNMPHSQILQPEGIARGQRHHSGASEAVAKRAGPARQKRHIFPTTKGVSAVCNDFDNRICEIRVRLRWPTATPNLRTPPKVWTPEMTEASIEQELQGLTEDELFLKLGYMHVGQTAAPESAQSLVERGRALFGQVKAVMQPILCRPGTATTTSTLTNASLVATINNAVANTPTFNLTHDAELVVAMLIIRHGLTRFCAGYLPPSKI
jgi:hypothetical protein